MYRQYEKPNTLKEALAHLKREYQIALENNADDETLIGLHDDIEDNKLSEKELYEEYGYLMDKEHGNDTELLIDIMKCNGVEVVRMDNEYLVTI